MMQKAEAFSFNARGNAIICLIYVYLIYVTLLYKTQRY